MIVVTDIETNALVKPDKIWCIVCIDVETEEVYTFDRPDLNPAEFLEFNKGVSFHIGHNFLSYDGPVLNDLLPGNPIDYQRVCDTLVFSRLVNYNLEGGHSLENWGKKFGIQKEGLDISDFSTYIPLVLTRCISDCKINLRLYRYLSKYITIFKSSLRTEHNLQLFCRELSLNGFPFDISSARNLHEKLQQEITPLDEKLRDAFPKRSKFKKEVLPKTTKSGSLNLSDFRFLGLNPDLSPYSEGAPFSVFDWEEFNPGSGKQIITRLNESGWKPTEMTKGHIEAIRDKAPPERLQKFQEFGWKISEENLRTLPPTAPEAAKLLVRRMILASRLSDIAEWLALATPDTPLESPTEPVQTVSGTVGYPRSPAVLKPAVEPPYSIHGNFLSIGSWTHRMAHQAPNMANIPIPGELHDKSTDLDRELYEINSAMRRFFTTRPGRILVGVDADGIQMRIFAHLINEPKLIQAIVSGNKKDRSDIHSLHWSALGQACKSRDNAKTFIYAFLLGAGVGKVSQILDCSPKAAKEAVDNFLDFYPGLKEFKKTTAKQDAKRGYFVGLDGRYVVVPEERKVLAGYLQNGEKVIMARAAVSWYRELKKLGVPFWIRNFVHDEWQTETLDDEDCKNAVANEQKAAIERQAEELNLRLPLKGDAKFGYNWLETH